MSNMISPKVARRLELRGVKISDDPGFIRMAPWSRMTFALCATFVGLGTLFAYTPLLWAMVPIAAIGGLFPRHPFDAVYNYGIRRLIGAAKLPKNAAPTRFACAVATPWIAAIALAFQFEYTVAAYVLGVMFVGVAGIVATTHFCIPSVVFHFLFGDRSLIVPAWNGEKHA
jgi:hypothetical protein